MSSTCMYLGTARRSGLGTARRQCGTPAKRNDRAGNGDDSDLGPGEADKSSEGETSSKEVLQGNETPEPPESVRVEVQVRLNGGDKQSSPGSKWIPHKRRKTSPTGGGCGDGGLLTELQHVIGPGNTPAAQLVVANAIESQKDEQVAREQRRVRRDQRVGGGYADSEESRTQLSSGFPACPRIGHVISGVLEIMAVPGHLSVRLSNWGVSLHSCIRTRFVCTRFCF